MCSWRGLFFSGLVVVLCGCTHHVSTQTCTKPDGTLFYVSSPQPTTDPFSNADTLGPGCNLSPSDGRLGCHSALRPILLDGVIGQKEGPPNTSTISAWSRNQSNVSITFVTADVVQVRHIRLYFYNIPSMNIGLPEVTLMAGGPQTDYHVTGNQHLSSIDNRRRDVILSYTKMVMTNTFEIIFGFIRTDVDWLLLSEVEFCEQIDGGSAQCSRNYSMSTNTKPDPIDVNTTLPFCFIVPQFPIVKCELNNENVNNSATIFPSGNNVAVMINDWITVNLYNTEINSFKCEAGPVATAEAYYAMFYSLIPGNLFLFVNGINGSYVEGTNVSIVCRNFNERPAFQGAVIWTNSSGYVVGNRSLEFVATGDRAGLYTCSAPTVPAIPTVSYRVLVTTLTTTTHQIHTTATKPSVVPSQQNNTPTNSPSIITAVIIVVVFVMVAIFIAIALVVVFLVCFQQKRKNATPAVTASPVFDTTEMSDKNSTRDIGFSAIGSNQNDSNYEESDYATVDNNNQVNNNKPSPESPEVHKSSVNEDVQSKGEHLQDVGQLYAVVDKNAKTIAMKKRVGKTLDVSGVYSAIDNEADAIIECEESELHDIAELYAVVDKSAKKKISEKQDLSQLYAVVDKSMKSKNIDA